MLVMLIWSCKKDETQIVSTVGPAGTLTATATELTLTLANGANPAVTFNFSAASVTGHTIPVTTTLQFDEQGNNFATPKEVPLTVTTYSPTVSTLNAMLLALDFKSGVKSSLEVRLKSAPAPNAVTYSNVLTLNVTPYSAESWIYVPGAYQGWIPETADSLISAESNGIYSGVLAIPTGQLGFKVTPAKNWDVAYGDVGGGAISTSGGDIFAPKAGLNLLTVDLNNKTYTMTEVLSWGVIGDATPGGWATDTDLKFINDGKNTWKATITLTEGSIKFRQNDAWDLDYGGAAGTLVKGGKDISVSAGTYTITFDEPNLKYSLVKN